MKPRAFQTAREVAQTRLLIERRLDRLSIETQPEVAAAILDLSTDRAAGLSQFARIIRGDPAMAARILRQSNAAYFCQDGPVADLDRACVVLGADRLRAAALGFTLDRASPRNPDRLLARRVWRHSIMRGCLAAELCQHVCERLAPAAFVAGLMLDAGQPLLVRLLGDPARRVLERDLPPHAGLAAELRELPFTHVDVVSVLCERWRLPSLLSGAIELHHAAVRDLDSRDDASIMRRVTHLAGLVELDLRTSQPRQSELISPLAERLLGLDGARLGAVFGAAEREFARMRRQLQGAAAGADDLDALAKRIHEQIDRAVDLMLSDALAGDDRPRPQAIRLGGSVVEIEHGGDGRWSLVLVDSLGDRIAIHQIQAGDGVPTILESLALELREGDQIDALSRVLRLVA